MANEAYSEKVSVNINSSTLSSIDLLVDKGYYSNRSDFINQALRTSLDRYQSTIDRIISQEDKGSGDAWFIGIYSFGQKDIEADFEAGKRYSISGYGVLVIDSDCPEDKLFSVVEGIKVKGKLICTPSVKSHYGIK